MQTRPLRDPHLAAFVEELDLTLDFDQLTPFRRLTRHLRPLWRMRRAVARRRAPK
jgi:hypothetical protein